MRDLILDGKGWKTIDDVYDAIFRALGAPKWHGRNFNALQDSILDGGINAIELPYTFVITNYDRIGGDAKRLTDDFIDFIRGIAAQGNPIDVRTGTTG
jgi:RNAse (barnase) inhibitor barstar